MRIVYLLNNFGISGGPVVLYNFAENLIKRKHEVYFVTPDKCIKWETNMKEKILKEVALKNRAGNSLLKRSLKSFRLHKLKNKITLSDFWFQHIFLPKFTYRLISNFVKNIKHCDILVCTLWATAFAGYFLSDKTNKVFYHMQHYEEIFAPDSSLKRKYIRMTYFFPFVLISNSTWLKNIIEKICKRSTYLLCPGIDIDLFCPSSRWEEKYKPKNKFIISSFVDGVREFKGSRDLFNVINILNKEVGEERVIFKLFGFSLPSFYQSIKNIEFHGVIPHSDLQRFYSNSDVFVWASWYESFPLPPIEAMACGTAVVTTKFGTEDYAKDEYNACVVLPRTPSALAKKILFLLYNLDKTQQIVKNALETVKEFSWEKQTEKLEQIFQESSYPTISSKIEWLVENLIKGKNVEEIDKMLE